MITFDQFSLEVSRLIIVTDVSCQECVLVWRHSSVNFIMQFHIPELDIRLCQPMLVSMV